ncbi:MAG: hypothetical protein KUG79_17195 [Pseudomonadales bacterium]|nr:hypothetical protein [Pseudomonadales bacterium]
MKNKCLMFFKRISAAKISAVSLSTAVALLFLLQGCMSTIQTVDQQIIGVWRSNIGGFNVVTEYTGAMVKVGSNKPVKYLLTENRLTFVGGGEQLRLVSFPSADEMLQLDPLTQTEHKFERLDP